MLLLLLSPSCFHRSLKMNETMCVSLGHVAASKEIIPNRHDLLLALAVVFSLIAALTVLANVTAIVALMRMHFRRCLGNSDSSKNTQLLMASMGVSDALLGIVVMPLSVYNIVKNRHWELGHHLCNIREVLYLVLSAASFLHVACMALDRYLAVCKPLLFRTLTSKRSLMMIAACWIIPASFMATALVTGWHEVGIEDVVFCSKYENFCEFRHNRPFLFIYVLALLDLPLVITLILYCLILLEVRRYHKRKPLSYYSSEKPETHRTLYHNNILNTSETVSIEASQKRRKLWYGIRKDHCLLNLWSSMRAFCEVNIESPVKPEWTATMVQVSGQQSADSRLDPLETSVSSKDPTLLPKNSSVTTSFQSVRNNNINREPSKSSLGSSRKVSEIREARARSSMKAVRTIGIVVACFSVCWLPINIVAIVGAFQNIDNPVITMFVLWLAYINSTLNPIIYCCQRSIRAAIRSLICQPCSR